MKKTFHGLIATIGFLLSPLTPWNDIFVNIPLAYGFATLVGLVSKNYFYPSIIVGYWLTNVLGLLMMQYGISRVSANKKGYTRKDLARDLLVSIVITLVLIVLIKMGILKFPTEYFK